MWACLYTWDPGLNVGHPLEFILDPMGLAYLLPALLKLPPRRFTFLNGLIMLESTNLHWVHPLRKVQYSRNVRFLPALSSWSWAKRGEERNTGDLGTDSFYLKQGSLEVSKWETVIIEKSGLIDTTARRRNLDRGCKWKVWCFTTSTMWCEGREWVLGGVWRQTLSDRICVPVWACLKS